jgi:type IV secretion system protein VirB11
MNRARAPREDPELEIVAPRDRSSTTPEQLVLARYLEPLHSYLADPSTTEIAVNHPGVVFTEGTSGWRSWAVPELSYEHLTRLSIAAAAMTRQDIGPEHPIVSTVLTSGERCQIVMPPAVPAGTVSLTIRKARLGILTLAAFEASGSLGDVRVASDRPDPDEENLIRLRDSGQWRAFLEGAVQARRTIVVAGATGSGKTTLAKALVACIPMNERLVTVEDTPELVVPQTNHVRLLYAKDGQGVSKVGPRDLLESCLRMRPDRILLQELRDGPTAFTYLRAVTSGHPGSITTLHADSAMLAFEQLGLLIRQSEEGRDFARTAVERLLDLSIDVVVHMSRRDGRHRITEIHYEPLRKRQSAS